MRPPLDLQGMTFGRLTALAPVSSDKSGIQWRCLCSCGKEIVLPARRLKRETRSCGCARRGNEGIRAARTTHGMTKTRTYTTWAAMRSRCTNPNDTSYYLYGARGVSVCDAWISFEAFHADMGDRPEGMSLDRIDGRRGYSPENCRWATPAQQVANRTPKEVA